jgi:hypothetical protein
MVVDMRAEKDVVDETTGTIQQLEFVTLTGRPPQSNVEISKQVRTHAMRDYVRKSRNKRLIVTTTPLVSEDMPKPPQLKGKFKLDSWTHNSKAKSKSRPSNSFLASKDTAMTVPAIGLGGRNSGDYVAGFKQTSNHNLIPHQLPRVAISLASRVDPFNSLSITMGPLSDHLLSYCESCVTSPTLC